jgi:hypothetical protein
MAATGTKRRTRVPASSTADIVAAIQVLNAQQDERGVMKHAPSIIVAILLGLIFWVGATLLSLNNTVTRMSANVDTLSKSISDLQSGQGASSKTIGDLQALTARQDARSDAIEADMSRVKERMRILEGQKPLELDRVANGSR